MIRKWIPIPVRLFVSITCLFPLNLFAHQPRLVGYETEVNVSLPEISKAYYGSLEGKPVTYHIEATEPFRLYVNILVPDMENVDKDVSINILKEETVLFLLDGNSHDWKKFHEPFVGDDYYRGPEYVGMQEPGLYEIRVYSPDNQGKYVLAIGDREAFPFRELVKTYVVLPRLKSEFFGKSPFSAYFNLMGVFLGIIILIALIILTALFVGIKLIKKRLGISHKAKTSDLRFQQGRSQD